MSYIIPGSRQPYQERGESHQINARLLILMDRFEGENPKEHGRLNQLLLAALRGSISQAALVGIH